MEKTYVYFIIRTEKNGSSVKIGVSKDPQARLKMLQTGNAKRLKIWHLFEHQSRASAFASERLFHDVLKNQRVVGEWFTTDGLMAQVMAAIKSGADEKSFMDVVMSASKKPVKVKEPDDNRRNEIVVLSGKVASLVKLANESGEQKAAYAAGFYSQILKKDHKDNPFRPCPNEERPNLRDWWFVGMMDSHCSSKPMATKDWVDEALGITLVRSEAW